MDSTLVDVTDKPNDNSEKVKVDEIKISSENKITSDNVFKKPFLIGPIRGKKPATNKVTNSEVTIKTCEEPEIKPNKKEVSDNYPPLPYSEPIWKGTTNDNFCIEELKSGVIQNTTDLRNKSFIVLGRVDCCDVVMSHPTISRYHAVIQYRGVPDGDLDKGFYIYDLDSTHGTYLNKARLKPRVYARIRVGHMVKFGSSTRFFVLQGPEYDQEDESDLTFTEMKEKRRLELEEKKQKEEEELRLKEEEEEKERILAEERGISWGLGEDAEEEDDLSENPYAIMNNEELYIDDPKKALRLWFEREGEEMNFETERVEKGMMACKIILPLDDERGKSIEVESSARSKKDAQFQCALEACRIIDRMGLFKQSKQEAKKRQARNWEENDFYDSDEDSFLDRTGDLDKKRQKRMKKVGKFQETVETYDSLLLKHTAAVKELADAEKKLQQLLKKDQISSESENEELDELDAYMKNLNYDKPGKLDIKKAKDEVSRLQKEEDHLRKLVNIAKPANVPELKLASTEIKPLTSQTKEKGSNRQLKMDTSSSSTNGSESKLMSTSDGDNKTDNIIKQASAPTSYPTDEVDSINKASELNRDETGPKVKGNKKDTTFPKMSKPKLPKKIEKNESEVEEDCTNLVWQPPKGQTGDGRTSLNDKFGY